jgi:tetraacyldisaccharide 4'-kinase
VSATSENSKLEKFWYSNSYLRWLLMPLSWLIQLIALFKISLYQLNILKSHSSKVPVLVVGNITVGGTGKTPFISFLISELHAKGLRVGLVSRGYHSKAPYYPYIVKGEDSVDVVGDEAFMQYFANKVPMVIGSKRAKAVELLTKTYDLDLIISDDGLQHYAMARDIEVMMIDASRLFGNQLMLPFGPLREPASRINSVDFAVLNGGEVSLLNQFKTKTSISSIQIETEGLVHLVSGETVCLSNLKDNKIHAVAGIGNPNRFFSTLVNHCDSFERSVFADHHQFVADDFRFKGTSLVVMTEKDAVKCKAFAKDNWYYLKVKATMQKNEFEQLYLLIQKVINNK